MRFFTNKIVSRPPAQQQLSRPVNNQRNHHEICQQIKPGWHEVLYVAYSAREINVVLRTPEKVDGHDDPGLEGCPLRRLRIAAEAVDEPEQKRRNDQVVEAEQADEPRDGWIEHVFGAADEMVAKNERPDEVDGVEALK